MVTLERPYKLDTGTAQCTNCGGSIRKYYMGLNDHRPVCSKCVNGVFGTNLSKQELAVPIRIIKLADKYALHRLYLSQFRGNPILSDSSFVEDFLGSLNTIMSFDRDGDKVFIEGKKVQKAWLTAISHHLTMWYREIRADEQRPIRKLLVCGNCKKPLNHHGSNPSTGHTLYTCLSGKHCANCNSRLVFSKEDTSPIKMHSTIRR